MNDEATTQQAVGAQTHDGSVHGAQVPVEPDPLALVAKQRKATLMQRKLALMRQNALAFYRPHAKQAAFHAAGARYKKRMVRAGNRFGKTQCGAAEDCAWLLGRRPWLTGDAATAGIPARPAKGLVICPDLEIVDRVWTTQSGSPPGKLWYFLPRSEVKSTHSKQGVIYRIALRNGSVLHFETVKSWKNDPLSMESTDWDFIHVDEPCPEAMYVSSARGLIDRGGSVWFTLTPLREPWINDMFFPQDDAAAPAADCWSIDGSIYDNPALNADAIASFERDLSPDEKQCRLFGIPLHLAGLIYKAFDRAKHVLTSVPHGWSNYNDPPRSYSIYYAIDPHPQTPFAVLFLTVSPQGQRFYFENIFKHCCVAELAADIHEVIRGRHVIQARMDPLGFIEDPISGMSMAEEFARCGIFVEKATKALAQGILHVQGELRKTPPALYFAPTLRRTLWEMVRYVWDEKENKPVDKDDHMMECLYRLELLEPRYVDRDDEAYSRPFKPLIFTKPELDWLPSSELRTNLATI